ncbi:MAG: 3-dehydroquinate synthase [Eggerthellaceae bacterium]|jgi:3-dehydroquinate synthase
MSETIEIEIENQRPYEFVCGDGLLDTLGERIRSHPDLGKAAAVFVLTDEHVGAHYLERGLASLRLSGFVCDSYTVPAGEGSKSLSVAEEIWEYMAAHNFGRDCIVCALGGGVVGDLAGFIASTYMRGLSFVQVPTSLLAMVDSSVGGKTAVNLAAGKNLVGTFLQPALVLADMETLTTLPDCEWVCGLGEVAKASVIDSPEFFSWLSDHASEIASRSKSVSREAILRSVSFKARIVAQDVRELANVRECLNYGHTLGHAIEQVAGFGTFSHGAAVAEGMRFAARLAQDLAGAEPAFVVAQDTLLSELGHTPLPWRGSAQELFDAMKRDKKTRGGKIRFVLATKPGQWELKTVEDNLVLEHLMAWSKTDRY